MTNRLQVIWNKRLVGTLDRHKKGRVVFQYSQDWIKNESVPVSLSLPCKKKKFAMAIGRTFKLDRIKNHSFEVFAKDMSVQPNLLISQIKDMTRVIETELSRLIVEHEKNYGEAKIYEDLNEVIKSNIYQLQSFFK